MEIYVMLSGKGGSGKTTLAVHLAVAAELSGKTVALIDLDPQGSAMAWGQTRPSATPVVVSADAEFAKISFSSSISNIVFKPRACGFGIFLSNIIEIKDIL